MQPEGRARSAAPAAVPTCSLSTKSRGETASGPASASSSRATLRRAGGRGWDAGMGRGRRGAPLRCPGGGRARRTGVEPGSPGACEGSVPAAGRRCMQQTEQQRLGRSAGARGCTGCMKPAWGTPALAAPAAAAAAAAAGAAHSMASVRDPQLALPAPPFFSVTCLHKAGVQGCVFQPKQASKQAQRSSSTAECMRMQACPAAWPAARCRHAHMGARKQSVCLAQRGVRRYGACAADCSAAGSSRISERCRHWASLPCRLTRGPCRPCGPAFRPCCAPRGADSRLHGCRCATKAGPIEAAGAQVGQVGARSEGQARGAASS